MSKSPSQPGKLVEFKGKSVTRPTADASAAPNNCPNCVFLRNQRDDALKALAEERETSNALRLGHSSAYHYVGSHVRHRRGETPLRYEVADAANAMVKSYFGFLHAATRAALSRLVQLRKRLG